MFIFSRIALPVAVVAATFIGTIDAGATTIRSGFDANTLAANDDDSTGAVAIGFTADFFGVSNTTLFVNNNGNVTFDSALDSFTPFDLTSTARQIIAPFFADVDTRGSGSDPVTYGTGTVDTRAAFGVNWVNVGYYGENFDLLNSFQLVLIDRSDIGAGNFDFEFNYGDIAWETGDASGGNGGLGGSSARAGYSNGTGVAGSFFELAGSATNGAFLNGGPNALNVGSNVGQPNRFVFSAREGAVVNPEPSVIPLPASLPLLLAGMGVIGLVARRRNRG